MDWKEALSTEAGEVEKNEELLERLYEFFLRTDLPTQGRAVSSALERTVLSLATCVSDSLDFGLLEDKANLLKLVSLLRSGARVKGLEAQAAEDELTQLQEKYDSATVKVGSSERDLLDQVG